MIEPAVLILGSRYDFTCDYVVAALRRSGTSCLRLNSEDLPGTQIALDPIKKHVLGNLGDITFRISEDHLRSILFRRPVFLRDYADGEYSPEQKFQRQHWAAFLRNLMIFDRCAWMNHPAATYRAEHKAVQLAIAHKLGFDIPQTIVTNTLKDAISILPMGTVAVKGLDTVLLRHGQMESFGYTSFAEKDDIREEELRAAPTIIQEALRRKLDLRVTVVGEAVYSVAITQNSREIYGDWRRAKEEAEFNILSLPSAVSARCVHLTQVLGLNYGAIDLAVQDDVYYFIEINPTGEWAWLVDAANIDIDEAVANWLRVQNAN